MEYWESKKYVCVQYWPEEPVFLWTLSILHLTWNQQWPPARNTSRLNQHLSYYTRHPSYYIMLYHLTLNLHFRHCFFGVDDDISIFSCCDAQLDLLHSCSFTVVCLFKVWNISKHSVCCAVPEKYRLSVQGVTVQGKLQHCNVYTAECSSV